jgi:HK97 family phage major capsid protein
MADETLETRTIPTVFYRDMTVSIDRAEMESRAKNDPSDDRIAIALSSESPVARYDWWTDERYNEVLDHAPESIDLSYARDGLPFLLEHSRGDMHGLIEDVRVDSDRVVRGRVKFSKAARSQEIRQDMLDGIRKKISVGYAKSEDYEQTSGEGEALPTRRYKKWMPMEASSVSIPADYNVGVGRSAPLPAPDATAAPAVPSPTTPAPQARSHTVSDQNTAPAGAAPTAIDRGAEIVELCELAGQAHRAGEMIRSNKTMAEIKAELRNAKAQAAASVTENAPAPQVPDYTDGSREFSIGNAVRALVSGDWSQAGYERAVSQAEAKRLGKSSEGRSVFMPTLRKLTPEEIATRTSHSVSVAGNGGNSVFSEYGGFIELLRKRALLGRLGATVLPGLQGNVTFPRQITAGTAYWMGEVSGADVTESNTTLDQVALSPKTLMGLQSYSNQLLAQSAINIDALIRDDLLKILGLELDRAGFHGTGASNQPTGIYGMSGINSKAFGGAISYDTALDMVTEIAADDADVSEIAFAMTPEAVNKASQTQRFTSTDTPIYTGTFANGSLIGYRAEVSNQLSKVMLASAATGGSEHGIVCGAWSQFLIGEWGSLQLTVDPYTKAGQDVVRLIARLFVDFDVRHPESFCKGTGQTV